MDFPRDCLDAEVNAPTVGALGDAGAFAEQALYSGTASCAEPNTIYSWVIQLTNGLLLTNCPRY